MCYPEYKTSPEKLKGFEKITSCSSISEQGRIRGITTVENRLYAITGGLFFKGTIYIEAVEIIPIEKYKGKKYTYGEKSATDIRGELFYQGIKVNYKGRQYVLTSKHIRFIPGEAEPVQLNLFT